MRSTLNSEAVGRALGRLRAIGEAEDPPAKQRVRSFEVEVGAKVYGRERAELSGLAPLSISAEVGELLYVLAMGQRARTIVEFGASLGVSSIYLAAALRDIGSGSLITTELQPEKARLAQANLAEAELDDLVDLRVGDARQSLEAIGGGVDLLFLDGGNDLYLEVLELVQPRLRPGALVAADLSQDDPHLVRYCEHVHDRAHGYVSVEVPLDEGVVVSTRVA